MNEKKRNRRVSDCPVCGHSLHITGLQCGQCGTRLDGFFSRCPFCVLSDEHLHFVMVFLNCRGNYKEMEKELQISYPTVKNKLEEIRTALGFSPREKQEVTKDRREILEMLSRGEITSKEALKLLSSDKD